MDAMISENGMRVLRARYLRRDDRGRIIETPAQLFERVARACKLLIPPDLMLGIL